MGVVTRNLPLPSLSVVLAVCRKRSINPININATNASELLTNEAFVL